MHYLHRSVRLREHGGLGGIDVYILFSISLYPIVVTILFGC